jgi:spore germination protein YaaH
MLNNLRKIFWIVLFLIGVILFAASIYIFLNPIVLKQNQKIELINYISNKSQIDIEHEQIRAIPKSPIPVANVSVTGWIPDWDMAGGIQTFQEQYRTFDSISPVYYFVNPDGSLKNVVKDANRMLIDNFAKSKNIEIIPAIQDFDADNLGQMLETPATIYKHNDQIINEIKKFGYDGIDLDYESTKLADKDKFFFMLEDLSMKIKREGKKLVFTVLPKWGDEISYEALPQTRKVQDWKQIADLVDELRIMTYELYGGNTIIGPIGPLEWLELNIQYAVYLGIPRQKIVLGVHTYSYDWSDRAIVEKIDYKNYFHNPELTKNLKPAVALYNIDVNKIRNGYDFQESFNEEWGEGIGRYNFKGNPRVVIFPTERSFELRKQLAAQYGIKGIAYWKVGGEGGMKLQ